VLNVSGFEVSAREPRQDDRVSQRLVELGVAEEDISHLVGPRFGPIDVGPPVSMRRCTGSSAKPVHSRLLLRLNKETGPGVVPRSGSISRPGPVGPGGRAADAVEGGEVLGVGVGEGMEVFLGGGDLSVTHAVHYRFEVGASGEQPGCVGVAQVVDPDLEVHARCRDGWSPDAGTEGVPREGSALARRNNKLPAMRPRVVIESASWVTSSGGRPIVRGSLSLG